jgi:Tol biopolymer transport system component
VADIPEDITKPADSFPLEGTPTTRPNVPKGLLQRRVTFTMERKHPGLQGPRVRLRTSPDGSLIYFHMKDDNGIVQIFTVPTVGGPIQQITKFSASIQSQFNVSPDGKLLSAIADNRVWLVNAEDGTVTPVTNRHTDEDVPVNGASWSPSGKYLVYNRYVPSGDQRFLQIFKIELE